MHTYDRNGGCEGRDAMLGVLEFGVGVHDFVHDLLVLELVARRAESGPTPCCMRGNQHDKIARDAHERPSTRQRASSTTPHTRLLLRITAVAW